MALDPPSSLLYSGAIWITDDVVRGESKRATGIYRRVLNSMDGLWTLCRPQVEILENWLGRAAPPIHYVPFGVDVEFYRRRPFPERPKIVSIGGDRDRDVDTLYAALELVVQRHPNVEVTVQTTSERTPPAGVSTFRFIPHVRVSELYGEATLVALATRPNLHGSGMTVALEAMASGRPVVATATPGMDDYILDGKTGYLVPPGAPDSMADRVNELLEDRDRAAEMGEQAHTHVQAGHTTHAMCRRIRSILDDPAV